MSTGGIVRDTPSVEVGSLPRVIYDPDAATAVDDWSF